MAALEEFKVSPDGNNLRIADAFFNIGLCKNAASDAEKAIPCFERALSILSDSIGENNAQYTETMKHMAFSYQKMGNHEKAAQLGKRALDQAKSREWKESVELLKFVSDMHGASNRHEDAARFLRECLRLERKHLGDDSLEVATTLAQLGTLYKSVMVDYQRALICFEECMRIRKTILEDRGLVVADTYLALGEIHECLRTYAKAVFCFDKACFSLMDDLEKNSDKIARAMVGKADALCAQGDFRQAIDFYTKAISIQGSTAKSEQVAHILLCKGFALSKLGQVQPAMQAYESSISMLNNTVGMNHDSTATAFLYIAKFHLENKSFDMALEYAEKSMTIRRNSAEKSWAVEIGDCHACMGEVYFAEEDLEEAKNCFEKALKSHIPARGETDMSVARSLFFLGRIYEADRNFESALECFSLSLAGHRMHIDRDSDKMGDLLFHLGVVNKKLGESEGASHCLRECLRIRNLSDSTENIDAADALYQLGDALEANPNATTEDIEESTQCFVEAIKMYSALLGDNHLTSANCFAKLGGIFLEASNLEKAQQCFSRSIAIFDATLPPGIAEDEIKSMGLEEEYGALGEALFRWSAVLDRLGRDQDALEMYVRCEEVYSLLSGKDDTRVATVLYNMASLYGRDHRYEEAMSSYKEALRIRAKQYGMDHEDVAEVLFGMGVVLDKLRKYAEAITCYEDCLTIRKKKTGRNSLDVGRTLVQIGSVYGNQGNFSKALSTWELASSIYRKNNISDDDELVLSLQNNMSVARNLMNGNSSSRMYWNNP